MVSVTNGNGSIIGVIRVRGENGHPIKGVTVAISTASGAYAETFIPKDRVIELMTALEDEAGV